MGLKDLSRLIVYVNIVLKFIVSDTVSVSIIIVGVMVGTTIVFVPTLPLRIPYPCVQASHYG
jgi:hypothetical protein